MLPEAEIEVTFESYAFGNPAYRALNIVNPLQRTAAVGCNAVYLNLLAAKLQEVAAHSRCSLHRCHNLHKEHYHQLYYYHPQEHAHRIYRSVCH